MGRLPWSMMAAGLAVLAASACAVESLDGARFACRVDDNCAEGWVCSPQKECAPSAPAGDTLVGADGSDGGLARVDAAPDEDHSNGVYADRLVIALSVPLSGASRVRGESLRAGIEAHLAQLNRTGGLLGRRLELRSYDNRDAPELALDTVREIAERRHVLALVASVGGDASEVSFVAEQLRVLLFTAQPGREIAKANDHVFRLRASLDEEADALVGYLTEVRQPSIAPQNIAVFAAGETSGDPDPLALPTRDAIALALKRRAGITASSLPWATAPRGASDVSDAAKSLLKWLGSKDLVAPVDGQATAAIILTAEVQQAALLMRTVRDEVARIRLGRGSATNTFALTPEETERISRVERVLFAALSDVDPAELATRAREQGHFLRDPLDTEQRHCAGTVLIGAVPDAGGDSAAAQAYRDDLAAHDPSFAPGNALAFEGHLVARLIAAGLERHGSANLGVASLIEALEALHTLDLGLGSALSLDATRHQASQAVWGSLLDWDCAARPLTLDTDDAAGMADSPALCRGDTCVLAGRVTRDLRLEASRKWLLRDTVSVGTGDSPVTLTIDAGTTVLGEEATRGTLVVQRLGRLVANGRADAPIVFTSSRPAGRRRRGDWGGLVLNGRAPINDCGGRPPPCEKVGELSTGTYGGDVSTEDGGSLRYVRVEFAGRQTAPDIVTAALALRGLGSGSTVDKVQVHMSGHHGLVLAGGTLNLRRVLATGSARYGLHWRDGWTGRGQYLACLQYDDAGIGGLNGSNGDAPQAIPRSDPKLSNITLVGSPRAQDVSTGILLHGATAGIMLNAIVLGWQGACLDIDDAETFALAYDDLGAKPSGALALHATILSCSRSFRLDSADLFRTDQFFDAFPQNQQANPLLHDPYNAAAPDFVPEAGSPALGSAIPARNFDLKTGPFFESVDYIGAVGPGSDWTRGWTTSARN